MSERGRQAAAAGTRGNDNRARLTKARRNAWLLAALAVLFYVGYMLWIASGGASNGG